MEEEEEDHRALDAPREVDERRHGYPVHRDLHARQRAGVGADAGQIALDLGQPTLENEVVRQDGHSGEVERNSVYLHAYRALATH